MHVARRQSAGCAANRPVKHDPDRPLLMQVKLQLPDLIILQRDAMVRRRARPAAISRQYMVDGGALGGGGGGGVGFPRRRVRLVMRARRRLCCLGAALIVQRRVLAWLQAPIGRSTGSRTVTIPRHKLKIPNLHCKCEERNQRSPLGSPVSRQGGSGSGSGMLARGGVAAVLAASAVLSARFLCSSSSSSSTLHRPFHGGLSHH
jgi:hypothetical protein